MTTLLLDRSVLDRLTAEQVVATALYLVMGEGWEPTPDNVVGRLALSYTAELHGADEAFPRAEALLSNALRAGQVVLVETDDGATRVDFGPPDLFDRVAFTLRFFAKAVGPTRERQWNNAVLAQYTRELFAEGVTPVELDLIARLMHRFPNMSAQEAAELVGWAKIDGALAARLDVDDTV